MMTSLLLVDVQGFEALAKGQANPAALVGELSHTMHGLTRQIAVMRAYCSNRVSSYRRTAYREAGFEIVETNGPDETLIRMSFDLYEFSSSDATYEEAILLGGSTDYTALARLARERLMMVSVVDHATISSALEALADGLIDLDDFEIDRSASIAPAPSYTPRERKPLEPLAPRAPLLSRPEKTPEKAQDKADDKADEKTAEAKPDDASDTTSDDDKPHLDHPEQHKPDSDRTEGDAWPDPKTGPVLVAGATAGAGAAALIASDDTEADVEKAETEAKSETDSKAEAASDEADDTKVESTDAPAIDVGLEDAIAASLSDDLAVSLSEDLGTDLDAELEAELAAELVADAPETKGGETPKTNGAAAVPVEDDSTIDALFADLAGGDEAEGEGKNAKAEDTKTTAVDPAVIAAPIDVPLMADAEADADVDQLLSRLMSDDLAGDDAKPKKAELDVVPER
jgi:hypothetical protein